MNATADTRGTDTTVEIVGVPHQTGQAIVDAIAGVDRAASAHPWTPAVVALELARSDRHYVTAMLDGRIVGFGGVALFGDEAHVMALAVHPDQQRRGIGRNMLEHLLVAAADAGVGAVTLEVRAGDARTRRLYGRAGFVEEGRRPGYYPDGEDAVIAWRR